MTKQQLRKIYLEKRMALSEAECFRSNRSIYDLFFAGVDLSFIKVLHTFLPMEGKKEPDTWLIVDRIRREFPHIQLSIPKVNPSSGHLENYNFEGLHQLRDNAWGIPEPVQGVPTSVEKIDMILVPLLVGDLDGHRIGYGKGYYDRLLSSCRPDCKKIGLSLFPPIEQIEAVEEHDQQLTALITPEGIISFLA